MRRFTAVSFIAAYPVIGAQFTGEVPEEMWAPKDWDGELANLIAVVACPCGEEPEVAQLGSTICGCGRVFMLAGDRIRVARPTEDPTPD
jgi:hypothetical protein